jgi:RecA/RadA recombinase
MRGAQKLKNLKVVANKEHGKMTIDLAKCAVRDMYRISTGSLAFDRILGGGWPVGKLSIMRGLESSAKTFAAYSTIGIAQNLCANCYRPVWDLEFEPDDDGVYAVGHCDCYKKGLFRTTQYPDEKIPEYKARLKQYEENSYEELRVALIDVERDFDPLWAKRIGVDDRRLVYVQADSMEQTIDIYDELVRTAEVDLIVLDSIAAMIPKEQIEKKASEWTTGLEARLMGRLTKKLTAGLTVVAKEHMRFPTQIWINQLREKINTGMSKGWGDSKVMPAGLSQLFTAAVIANMWPSEWKKEEVDPDLPAYMRGETGVSVNINIHTLKNKTAPPKQKGSFRMIVNGEYSGKIDEVKYFLAQAEKCGLWKEEVDGKKKTWRVGKEEVFKTKKEAVARMLEPKNFHLMRELILAHMLGTKPKI